MTGGGGKDLATQGLGLIAKGLTEALGELKELGMVGEAGANPYASEEDVEKMGWGDIATSGAYGGDVDYSKESFEQAWANSKQGWKDATRDVMTSRTLGPVPGVNPENLHSALGMSDEQYDRLVDDVSGPSPEARANEEANELVHGSPDKIRASAKHLRDFHGAFDKVGQGLKKVDSSGWKGEGGDAFREKFGVHPAKWAQAAEAC
uniref:putative T7SS-secreted protein n=1 Tax=Streptomyces sp. NRRL WC-3725 TaxID=1463933 RepID=UPI003B63326F